MAINSTTASTLSDWFTQATAAATPAASKAITPATTTPAITATPTTTGATFGGTTAAAAPTATKAANAASSVNVGDWYKTVAGRTGEQAGLDHWQAQLDAGADPAELYKSFVKSAVDNNDYNPSSLQTKPALLDLDSLKNRDVSTNQTVAGQLSGLLDANSDYIQSARDRAQRAANARGLSNSSIAASVATSAKVSAIPTSNGRPLRTKGCPVRAKTNGSTGRMQGLTMVSTPPR